MIKSAFKVYYGRFIKAIKSQLNKKLQYLSLKRRFLKDGQGKAEMQFWSH